MKQKMLALLLAVCLLAAMAMPTAAQVDVENDIANELIWFELYDNSTLPRPNGFTAEVIRDVVAEDLSWEFDDWWDEENPVRYHFVDAQKFEDYANARFDISAAKWEQIRSLQVYYYYDEETYRDVLGPAYSAEQGYVVTYAGGYGGGTPSTIYEGYVKEGNFYYVYLQIVDNVYHRPDGVEGEDYEVFDDYGDEAFRIFTGRYLRHKVTYQNGIVKKYSSEETSQLPDNLTVTTVATTTTTTTTTKKPTTTTTTTTSTTGSVTTTTTTESSVTTTTTAVPETLVQTEQVQVQAPQGAFPQDTEVKAETVTEQQTVQNAQTVLEQKAEKLQLFDITAQKDGVTVQPDATVTVTFAIPEGFDASRVGVYYIPEQGDAQRLSADVNASARTVTVQLEHFSLYAVVQEKQGSQTSLTAGDNATTTTTAATEPADTGSDMTLIIVIAAAAAALVIAAIVIVLVRKKK
jgi:hypothetical protein